jgi:hypothetical protein
MRLERGRESDYSRGRMALRNRVVPTGQPKSDLGEFEKTISYDGFRLRYVEVSGVDGRLYLSMELRQCSKIVSGNRAFRSVEY